MSIWRCMIQTSIVLWMTVVCGRSTWHCKVRVSSCHTIWPKAGVSHIKRHQTSTISTKRRNSLMQPSNVSIFPFTVIRDRANSTAACSIKLPQYPKYSNPDTTTGSYSCLISKTRSRSFSTFLIGRLAPTSRYLPPSATWTIYKVLF